MGKVFRHSIAQHGARLVALALADNAHDDGVAFPSQQTIADKTLLSVAAVRDAIRWLEEHGELETRQAQRRRARVNVYRLLLPGLDLPDYERLPFKLLEPFGLPPESSGSQEGDDDRQTGARPAPESEATTARFCADHRQNGPTLKGRTSSRTLKDPSVEPSEKDVEPERPAAAAALDEAPRISDVVTALERFDRVDIRSLNVVEPLATRLPAPLFDEAVEEALRRRDRARGRGDHAFNDVGQLVQLLRIQIDSAHREHTIAVTAAIEEQQLRHRDPAVYLEQMLLPPVVVPPAEAAAFIERYARDEAEKAHLYALELQIRSESQQQLFKRAIVQIAQGWGAVPFEQLRAIIDEHCDDHGLDHIERGILQELAEDARDGKHRPQLQVVPGERAA